MLDRWQVIFFTYYIAKNLILYLICFSTKVKRNSRTFIYLLYSLISLDSKLSTYHITSLKMPFLGLILMAFCQTHIIALIRMSRCPSNCRSVNFLPCTSKLSIAAKVEAIHQSRCHG